MLLLRCDFGDGYISSANSLNASQNCMVSPSKNLLMLGNKKPIASKGLVQRVGEGGEVTFNVAGGYASLGSYLFDGKGSVFSTIGRAIVSVGTGPVLHNGSFFGISASTTPQITLYSGGAYGSTYQMGLSAPSAPTVAARTPDAGFTGKNSGSFSVKITRIRSSTGAESAGSLASNVITTDKQSVRVTFPAAATGQDKWGVYVTQAGFGSTGPYYLLAEYTETAVAAGTIDSIARSLQIEWADGDVLATLAPIDNFPPPASTFGAAISDCIAFIGCYGDTTLGVSSSSPGTAIAVSLSFYPELFPPDNLLFLPGPPTAVLSRGTDGYAYVAGADFLCALTYTGGAIPLTLQELWPNTGVQAQHNLCIADGELFAFTAKRGAVRMSGGEVPDSQFSARVADDMAAWTPADVVVGYDAHHQLVCFMHGTTILAYNKQTDVWCAPLDVSSRVAGAIVSCVTVDGGLLISASNPANVHQLNDFNTGTGSSWEAYTPAIDSGGLTAKNINRVDVALRLDSTTSSPALTLSTSKAGRASSTARTYSLPVSTTGLQHFKSLKPNARNAHSFSVKVSATSSGGDSGPVALEVYGEPDEVAR